MSNDSPKFAGHTFSHSPIPYKVSWEPNLIEHRLADGTVRMQKKGFTLKASLSWKKSGWLTEDDYSALTTMFNQLTATAKFYPRPDTYPSRVFNMQIVNEFNFTPHMDLLQKEGQFYEGVLKLESSPGEITATASVIF